MLLLRCCNNSCAALLVYLELLQDFDELLCGCWTSDRGFGVICCQYLWLTPELLEQNDQGSICGCLQDKRNVLFDRKRPCVPLIAMLCLTMMGDSCVGSCAYSTHRGAEQAANASLRPPATACQSDRLVHHLYIDSQCYSRSRRHDAFMHTCTSHVLTRFSSGRACTTACAFSTLGLNCIGNALQQHSTVQFAIDDLVS